MPTRGPWLCALVVCAGLFGGDPAEARQPAVDVDALGPQVGARAPDFTGRDHQGRTQSLQSLMGPRGVMLVFNRSADW